MQNNAKRINGTLHFRVPRKTLLVMKITTLLLLITIMTVSANTLAQKISLNEKNASLEQVLNKIRQQSGYDFVYSEDLFTDAPTITVTLKDATLDEALKASLKNQALTFIIENGAVVFKPKEESFLDNLKNKIKAELTQVTITGRVVDELGNPMVGVTVKQKGTTTATATDIKGTYTLTVPDNNTIIAFSFIGFEPIELAAKDISVGSVITMKATATNLKEVLVDKGYYNEKRELLTGNVGTVTSAEIEEQPVSNPLLALEGKLSGVFVKQSNGYTGSSVNVQIRGQNSIAQGNTPLYIVDGVPYTSQSFSASPLSAGAGSPLNLINPYDIEDIEILKDADATAIYGSRGASGVVLITTKKGKPGDVKVDINFYSGVGSAPLNVQWLNTQQYLQIRHQALKNDGITPTVANSPDILYYDTTRYTNWQKQLIGGTAHYTDAEGSISGGNASTQFTIGGGYHRETTVLPGDFADKEGSVHFNIINTSPNKKLKISFSTSYKGDFNNTPGQDLAGYVPYLPPDAPSAFNPDGSLNWANSTWPNGNPYAALLGTYSAQTYSLISNAVISYNLTTGINFKINLGYNDIHGNQTSLNPLPSIDPANHNTSGYSQFINSQQSSWVVEPQVNYSKKIGIGMLNALAGVSFQQNSTNVKTFTANGFTSDALLTNVGAAASVSASQSDAEYKYNGIYGRLNYIVNDRYIINATIRRDGSSRFGPGEQWGTFGAGGVAWIFSKEKVILNDFPWLSFGKLRGSYGTSGNDQIGDYKYLDFYKVTNFSAPYQGVQGLTANNLFNPDFSWEINRKLEGGLELGFLNDRIYSTISYYRNRSSNQLVGYPLAELTGFTSIVENLPATVQNTGIEVTLNTVNIKSKDFFWSTTLNITLPKNKLIAFPNLSSSTYANTLVIGQPITVVKLYNWAGVNPATGLYQYINSQGNLTSSPNASTDKTVLVNNSPDIYGGFQNTFRYKAFQVDLFFQFTKQSGRNLIYNVLPGAEGYNQPTSVLGNYWSVPGDNKNLSTLSQNFGSTIYSQLNSYDKNSTHGYSDASYLRLKNLSISWELPSQLRDNLHVKNFRIFLQGQNLLTFTKFKNYDPELVSANNVNYSLPPLCVFTVGGHITF